LLNVFLSRSPRLAISVSSGVEPRERGKKKTRNPPTINFRFPLSTLSARLCNSSQLRRRSQKACLPRLNYPSTLQGTTILYLRKVYSTEETTTTTRTTLPYRQVVRTLVVQRDTRRFTLVRFDLTHGSRFRETGVGNPKCM